MRSLRFWRVRPSKPSPRPLPDRPGFFCSPESISAYVGRLEATTLPFAIDAAQLVELVPPRKETEYLVLDDACGAGAAIEWIINEFNKAEVALDITATDCSAVMINEVAKRRELHKWGENVKTFVMDAQVTLKRRIN